MKPGFLLCFFLAPCSNLPINQLLLCQPYIGHLNHLYLFRPCSPFRIYNNINNHTQSTQHTQNENQTIINNNKLPYHYYGNAYGSPIITYCNAYGLHINHIPIITYRNAYGSLSFNMMLTGLINNILFMIFQIRFLDLSQFGFIQSYRIVYLSII